MPDGRQDVYHILCGILGPKMVIECGANVGQDTAWLAAIPGVTLHALEPDSRNMPRFPLPLNVTWHQLAVGGIDGKRVLHLSDNRRGRTYTKSSSLLAPTGHRKVHPDVVFNGSVEVDCIRLDTFMERHSIKAVDLIWADVQGAEAEMIAGADELLRRTRYLYTEYSDTPLYEGQPDLRTILLMLPGWRVIRQWPYDVLLENAALANARTSPHAYYSTVGGAAAPS